MSAGAAAAAEPAGEFPPVGCAVLPPNGKRGAMFGPAGPSSVQMAPDVVADEESSRSVLSTERSSSSVRRSTLFYKDDSGCKTPVGIYT